MKDILDLAREVDLRQHKIREEFDRPHYQFNYEVFVDEDCVAFNEVKDYVVNGKIRTFGKCIRVTLDELKNIKADDLPNIFSDKKFLSKANKEINRLEKYGIDYKEIIPKMRKMKNMSRRLPPKNTPKEKVKKI